MDRLKLTEMLDLHPYGALTVEGMQLINWGRDVIFTCTYDPGEPGKPARFRLVFADCRDIRWRIYTHISLDAADGVSPMPPTPVINLTLGTDGHRKPANLLTDTFGLSVVYGALRVERE